jgi:hypothetical protein
MSGFEAQRVGWETVIFWAERTAVKSKARHNKIASRAANSIMKNLVEMGNFD